jgi:cephalosporin hydroxylase
MVILDSDHSRDHVLAEMRAYADLVTPGSYLIVEDTIVNGNPVAKWFGPGPMEAVDAFLAEDQRFVIDDSCEKLMFTFNHRGYLRRR